MRLMEILINIDVESVPDATMFYTRAFGLSVGRRFDDAFVEIVGGSSKIYLLQKSEGSPAIPHHDLVRDYARHWTPVHMDFVVEDIVSTLENARAAGATIESDIRIAKYGKIAYGSDPWGNGFCIIEFIGRGYDELL